MQSIGGNHPLRRMFAGLVEHAFCTEVGMCDPGLTDYVAELLVDFTHIDRLNAIRNASGKPLDQVAAMLVLSTDEAPSSTADRDRAMYRRMGDYTLFWAGVYPEQLKRASHDQTDVLLDYVSQGKRSYALASDIAKDDDAPPSSLFRQLSEEFEFCLYGLGLVRRGWEETMRTPGGSGDIVY